LSFLTTISVFSQGYEIKISLKSKNDTVMLGHYFAKRDMMIPDDTVVLDKSGTGIFKGKKKLDRGVYFIINDQKQLFDIIIGDEQKFEILVDTADMLNKTRFKSSIENDVFFGFQRYNIEKSIEMQQLRQEFETATEERKNAIRIRLQEMNKERIEYIQQTIDAHKGLYVSKFLNSLVPIDSKLPDYPRDAEGNITDSTYLYRWYRSHFFDNFDIYNPDMLRTPLYEEKLMEYMTRVIPQHPDTICVEADKILAKTKSNDDIFRCVLVSLFNYYTKSKIMVHENVWVHLADKWYIPNATWSTADYIETLKKEVEKRRYNLIGMMAPPMEMLMALPPDHFRAAALDTAIKFDLYAGVNIQDFRKSLKGKYTVILFWDYACSHCKKVIQDLFQVYEEYKDKGLTVVTVQTVISREAKGKWIDYINEHQFFGWTNAWSPFSNKYRDLYDVSMTPIIFLLDEDEKIIGKRLVPEQIKDFIE
jgi:thiol-disulfide isomerase/thioredoxin